MKKKTLKTIISLLFVSSVVSSCSSGGIANAMENESVNNLKSTFIISNSNQPNKIFNYESIDLISTLPKEDLNDAEKNGLIQMREEEKLARDVYMKLYEKWEHRTFKNINASEQRHMDAIKVLLERYSIEDPIKNDIVGVFESKELQKLYYNLIEQGNKSFADALKVGATIEDLDIKDLITFLETVDNVDIKTVYQNLLKGSRNHLRAFVRVLKFNKESYTPQYISQETYNNILSSKHERGRVDATGNSAFSSN